ncbi:hypothetical protein ACIRST_32280 [Kitasatospora sp. NPDC101447]|uniref:hypothetical protein n=1 Tax=Kitasatospora sp. NPDC101447 TaxID=3364102 RepID=UPI00381E3755
MTAFEAAMSFFERSVGTPAERSMFTAQCRQFMGCTVLANVSRQQLDDCQAD